MDARREAWMGTHLLPTGEILEFRSKDLVITDKKGDSKTWNHQLYPCGIYLSHHDSEKGSTSLSRIYYHYRDGEIWHSSGSVGSVEFYEGDNLRALVCHNKEVFILENDSCTQWESVSLEYRQGYEGYFRWCGSEGECHLEQKFGYDGREGIRFIVPGWPFASPYESLRVDEEGLVLNLSTRFEPIQTVSSREEAERLRALSEAPEDIDLEEALAAIEKILLDDNTGGQWEEPWTKRSTASHYEATDFSSCEISFRYHGANARPVVYTLDLGSLDPDRFIGTTPVIGRSFDRHKTVVGVAVRLGHSSNSPGTSLVVQDDRTARRLVRKLNRAITLCQA